jgi:copper homeostasis protein
VLIEVCVVSSADAAKASEAGADRIELCKCLSAGGLTPEPAEVAGAVESSRLPVMAIVRPRTGGFVYSGAELDSMTADCRRMIDAGASGIVIGALTRSMEIDIEAVERFRREVRGLPLVFHRAFDLCLDLPGSLENLVRAGVDRVLTSAGARAAHEGAGWLAELQRLSAGRIEILPGGGVRPWNVVDLLTKTRCRQVHGSFSRPVPGGEPVLEPEQVRMTRRLLDGM